MRGRKMLGWLVALAMLGGGPLVSVAQATPTRGGSGTSTATRAHAGQAQFRVQWQRAMAQVHPPDGRGCYRAAYPSLRWIRGACGRRTHLPREAAADQTSGPGPQTVGNTADYAAAVPGSISQATGTFPHVSTGVTETGQVAAGTTQVANSFSLQLNAAPFKTSLCSGSTNAACRGWQQFIYSTTPNAIFIQYWLLAYDTTCPSGWTVFARAGGTDCYLNSPAYASPGAQLTAADLAKVRIVGTVSSGGTTQVAMTLPSGSGLLVSATDQLGLAGHWNAVEWNVFGDEEDNAANFGASTTITAQVALAGTGLGLTDNPAAPTCSNAGYTGETNNLTLSATAALGTVGSPTIQSTESNGTASTASCATAGPSGTHWAPQDVTAPAVSGTPQVGQTLTANVGSWTYAPTRYAYQWEDCDAGACSDIAGATGATYTPTAPDINNAIQVAVTATNAYGSNTAVSGPTGVVPGPPVGLTIPAITGTSQQGQTLTAVPGTFTNSPTAYAYQWRSYATGSWQPIPGATAQTYTPAPGDVSEYLDVTIVASNSAGNSPTTVTNSVGPIVIAPPANTVAPSISVAKAGYHPGARVAANLGQWANMPTSDYALQWLRCTSQTCTPISRATDQTYTLTTSDLNRQIEMTVTATNASASASASSARTVTVTTATASFSKARITGHTLHLGARLPAGQVTKRISFSWQTGASFGPSVPPRTIAKGLALYSIASGRQLTFSIASISTSHGRLRLSTPRSVAGVVLLVNLRQLHLTRALRASLKHHHLHTVIGTFAIETTGHRTYRETVKVKV